ncbi:MAG: DUF697 domain-containing protein [Opitutales bacterium]|nr:DUF697 domain-containing protein [Opitutales bacterium]
MTKPTAPREDDTGYNNPTRPSRSSRPLGAEERAAFHAAEVEPLDPDEIRGELTETEDNLHGAFRRALRWGRGAILLVALLVLFTGLMAYVVAVDIYLRLETLPLALQVPFWILLALFSVLLLRVVFQGMRLWWRLRSLPQISLPAPLAEANPPSDTEAAKAREALLPYVRGLHEDRARLDAEWSAFWPAKAPQQPAAVLRAARALTDPAPVESSLWLEDLQSGVLRPLDAVANERIWHYTKIIGLKTAISPFPLIDALAVLYNTGRMLHDLALLYNRRIHRAQIALLLGLVIFQTYVASQAQEVLESGAEEMSGFLSNNLARASGKLIGARIAEGTVNGLVARRLGRRALRYLRPVTK